MIRDASSTHILEAVLWDRVGCRTPSLIAVATSPAALKERGGLIADGDTALNLASVMTALTTQWPSPAQHLITVLALLIRLHLVVAVSTISRSVAAA